MRPVFTVVIVFTILIAVATALIAPSIDMPDGVMREHHVATHASSGHGSSNLADSAVAVHLATSQNNGSSRSSEILHLYIGEQSQSFVVLRC